MELVVPALPHSVRPRPLATPLQQRGTLWAGIPFFYWYQLLCVIIGAVLTAIVYFATEH
jgi:hypothetical protein